MKKLFLICFCFIISNNIEAKDFTHAKPDTSEMMIEMSGLLKAGIQKCSFSQNEIEKTSLISGRY